MLWGKLAALKLRSAASSNEKAFTLIEVLLALTIFMIVISFVTPIFHVILEQKESKIRLQTMEWEVFCNQFKKEIRFSTKAEVIGTGQLLLTKGSDTVSYERYETNIRRRVNFTGHEIVLQHVSTYSFTLLKNAVKVTVTDSWGKEHSVIAYPLVEWENPL
ncbi:competence type IV pilus minor pilin ComGF [Neobacillus mesonae]|uniref:competence type IV pilus minor pilin ComGF n=1 Tax=Neobacillus mesonae TaxID=1193713 RepID=UPI00203FE53B|nr:competence type IV pilus minor pilin ComGF [Neobacillus mesonae]MCM3566626.1 prepilin-type N-terminal cleavage/methylation domain-containing protein [Neobacillus mesonae]